MGNRAVIVADDVTNKNKKERCGIYLHWYGGRASVETSYRLLKTEKSVLCKMMNNMLLLDYVK